MKRSTAKCVILVGAALLLAASSPVALGSESPPPQAPASSASAPDHIVGIRLVGNQTVSAETVLYYLGVKVGDPYDPELIRRNFKALWEVGLFDNLKIESEKGPGGVTLIVTVEERPTVTVIDYSGSKKLSTSQIKDALKEANVSIKTGAPLSLKEVAKARAAIAELYRVQGFRSATVDFRIEEVSKTEKKIVFAIDEGEKVKIASMRFSGNTVFPQWRIRLVMKKTKVNTWWRVLSDKTVYSQANYEADVENIKSLYQNYGYKDIVVKDPILDVYVANPKQKKATKIRRKVRITIPVVEGDRYYFGQIDVSNATVIPRGTLLRYFKDCRPGRVLNRSLLVEALAEVEKAYRQRGYIFIYMDPEYKETDKRRVDINVKLSEGEKFYLGRVEFAGNMSTKDKVLRRELTLDEGQVMNMEAFKKSLLKIQQLGFFKVSDEPEFKVRAEEKKVDVQIKGEETSRNEINFGAGYSQLDGLFVQFAFATRNFLGRGEILSVAVQRGKFQNLYDVSYTVPWFADKNQNVGFSLYNRDLSFLQIDERRRGGSLYYAKGRGIFDSWSLVYSLEDVTSQFPVQGAPVPPGQPIPPRKLSRFDGTTSSLTPGYRYDSRNDPFDPTRGEAFSAGIQFAGLGGTSAFIKPVVGATTYVPFLRHRYFGLHGEVGYLRAFGSRELPPFERFLLGEPSVRGFGIQRIVPLHDNNRIFVDNKGRILGGTKYFIGNVEYVFATAGPIKMLSFFDVANTWAEGQNITFKKTRYSAGLELRIFLPIFQAPLRFIYSWNLHPIQALDQFGFPIRGLRERHSGFDFTIGSSF